MMFEILESRFRHHNGGASNAYKPMKILYLYGTPIKTLEIFHNTYTVEYTEDENQVNQGEKAWGCIDPKRNRIKVLTGDDMAASAVLQSLLHEVIHGLDASLHTGLNEQHTDRLAMGLADFLLRNRWMLVELEEEITRKE